MDTKEYEEAKEIVLQEIRRRESTLGELTVVDELSVILTWGVIFVWNSSKFLETRDPNDACYGNVPILVDLKTKDKIYLHFADAEDFLVGTLVRNYAAKHGYPIPVNLDLLLDKL